MVFSVTTKTEKIAHDYLTSLDKATEQLSQESNRRFLKPELHDLSEIDFDDLLVTPPQSPNNACFFYLFLLPSYNIDTINDTLLQHLEETHHDF